MDAISTSHVKVPIGRLYHMADVTHGVSGIVVWYQNNDINSRESHCAVVRQRHKDVKFFSQRSTQVRGIEMHPHASFCLMQSHCSIQN